MFPNIGLVGAAGTGKTTAGNLLVTHFDYHKHALADAMKVGQGWMIHLQRELTVPYHGPDAYSPPAELVFPQVTRIMHGLSGSLLIEGEHLVSADTWEDDVHLRHFLVDFMNREKPKVRGLLQQWGTEAIRNTAQESDPAGIEPWVTYMLREMQTSRKLGHPTVCDDMRYPHEIALTNPHHFLYVRMLREHAQGVGIAGATAAHSSEHSWQGIPCHYEIENNGYGEELLADCLSEVLGHFRMTRGILRGVRDRAEQYARRCIYTNGLMNVWVTGEIADEQWPTARVLQCQEEEANAAD